MKENFNTPAHTKKPVSPSADLLCPSVLPGRYNGPDFALYLLFLAHLKSRFLLFPIEITCP